MTTAPQTRDAFGAAAGRMPTSAIPAALTCAVRLIDRRTGRPHRVNGQTVVLYTRQPADAVAELLSGRDASVWEARVEPIEA